MEAKREAGTMTQDTKVIDGANIRLKELQSENQNLKYLTTAKEEEYEELRAKVSYWERLAKKQKEYIKFLCLD